MTELPGVAGEGHLEPEGWIAMGLVFLLRPILLKITRVIFPIANSELNCCMFTKCHLCHLFQLTNASSFFEPLLKGQPPWGSLPGLLDSVWHSLLHNPTAPRVTVIGTIALCRKPRVIPYLLTCKILKHKDSDSFMFLPQSIAQNWHIAVPN